MLGKESPGRRLLTPCLLAALSLFAASPAAAEIKFEEGPDTVTTSKFEWDFGNAGGNVERVEELKWRGSTGTLGANISAGGGGYCGDPAEFWGQSYGNEDSHGPGSVVGGHRGTWVARSHRTIEINGATPTICSGDNPSVPVRTRYTFFDQGAAANQVRIERRWAFPGNEITSNPAQGMRTYVPRVPYGTYNQEIYPNSGGTALVTDGVGEAIVTNWNQTWMAVNASSTNSGYVILRDPADTMPARIRDDYDSSSGSNNSGISLDRPVAGWVAPVTETEYLCFYDETSWPVASRSPTTLPAGCAATVVPINVNPPTLSPGAGNPRLGEQFAATSGTWENVTGSYSYQWSRCHEETCEQIPGETGTTHTATAADVGSSLQVTVTATAPGGETDSADSSVVGSISGHVYEDTKAPANLVASAPVQVCRRSGSPCRSTVTDGAGFYKVQVPVSGKYTVTAFPPSGSKAVSHTRATVARVRPETETTGQDVILPVPKPPPPQVGFSGSGVRPRNAEGVPVVYWQQPFVIEYETDITDEVEAKVEFTDGNSFRVPSDQPVEAKAGEPAIGVFKMRIPALYPNHGAAHVTIIARHPLSVKEEEEQKEEKEKEEQEEQEEEEQEEQEDEEEAEEEEPEERESEEEKEHEKEREKGEEEKEKENEEHEKENEEEKGPPGTEEIEFPLYIDPSGVVRTTTGAPLPGATVVLLQGASKEGSFTAVPDGSAVMSPMNRRNPDLSEADGHFGWDVIAGLYKVRVEKSGCNAPGDPGKAFVETAVQTIPPPVTDLELRLECPPPPNRATLRARLSLGKGGTIKVDKKGRFKVKSAQVECPPASPGPCTVKLIVTATAPPPKRKPLAKKTLKLGTSSLSVGVGKSATLVGKLSKPGLRKLQQAKRLKAKIAVSASVPGGEATPGSISATLVPTPSHRRHR